MRCLLALSVMYLTAAFSTATHQGAVSEHGTREIIGVVVDGSDGGPIEGARVVFGESASVLTGPAGRFAFRHMSPGTFRLEARKHGYVGGLYGQLSVADTGSLIKVSATSHRMNVRLTLWPTAIVEGAVGKLKK